MTPVELADAHAGRIEITPFDAGSTGRQPRPPMRGRSTFAPLPMTDYARWRRRRGQRDRIVEVVVCGGIPDIDSCIREVESL